MKNRRTVYNAIVWQCRRTSEYRFFERKRSYNFVKTGLVIDAYFSRHKIVDAGQCPGVENGRTSGTSFRHSGDMAHLENDKKDGHVTDYSNASRTMLFNINTFGTTDPVRT